MEKQPRLSFLLRAVATLPVSDMRYFGPGLHALPVASCDEVARCRVACLNHTSAAFQRFVTATVLRDAFV